MTSVAEQAPQCRSVWQKMTEFHLPKGNELQTDQRGKVIEFLDIKKPA